MDGSSAICTLLCRKCITRNYTSLLPTVSGVLSQSRLSFDLEAGVIHAYELRQSTNKDSTVPFGLVGTDNAFGQNEKYEKYTK